VNIVRMYPQRHHSFQEDNSIALAGIADASSSRSPGTWFSGLWSGQMVARVLLCVSESKKGPLFLLHTLRLAILGVLIGATNGDGGNAGYGGGW